MRQYVINIALMILTVFTLYAMGELTDRGLQHLGMLPDYTKKQDSEQQKAINAHNPKLKTSDNSKLHIEYDITDPRVNAFGMRGLLPLIDKKPDTFRIAVLGDSVGFGFGLARENSFPFMLEKLLQKRTGRQVEVLNFSVIGYGLEANLEIYQQKARLFHPDLVILTYILNDMTPPANVFVIIKDIMKEQAKLKRLARYSQFAAWTVVTWNEAKNKISGDHSFTAQYKDPATTQQMTAYMATLKQATDQDKTQLLAVIFPYFSELDHYPFETIHAIVAESMQKTDIAHFDLIDTFRDKKAETLQLQAGDITHPNGEGNRIAAEAITEQILQLGLIH